MKRAISGLLVSGGGFIAGFITPALLFMIVSYTRRPPAAGDRGSTLDEVLLLVYYIGVYALVDAIAYAAITAASRNWRQRALRQVVLISALVGVAAQILHWTGLPLFALVPLARVLPHGIAIALGVAMPGVVVGGAVLLWSATRKPLIP